MDPKDHLASFVFLFFLSLMNRKNVKKIKAFFILMGFIKGNWSSLADYYIILKQTVRKKKKNNKKLKEQSCYHFLQDPDWNSFIHLEMGPVESMVVLYLIFVEPPYCFPSRLHHFTFPPTEYRTRISPRPGQHVVPFVLLTIGIQTGVRWHFIAVWIHNSQDVEMFITR